MSHSLHRSLAALVALAPATLALAACNAENAPVPAPSALASEDPAAPSATESIAEDPFVADPAESEAGFPTSFRALGTEPFWALHVSDGRMRYTTPEDQEGKSVPYTRDVTADHEVALRAELDGKPLVLTGRIAECSDGMSDREYPFAVELRIGDELRNGCGRPIEP
jgi:uncharacterized membrane protein